MALETDALDKHWWNNRRLLAFAGALALGAAAGLVVGSITGSVWAGGLALVSVVYLVGRALPDIVREGDRWSRAIYFLVLPLAAWAVAVAVWLLLGQWWLGVVIGAPLGWLVQRACGLYLLPRVERQEEVHTWEAIPGDEFQVPTAPEEEVPGRYRKD